MSYSCPAASDTPTETQLRRVAFVPTDDCMASNVDILLCTDYLPPSDGGVEHVVDHLARRLAAHDYAVGIFTLSAPDTTIDLAEHPDIEVMAAPRIDLTDYIGLQSAVSPAAIGQFKRALDTYDPDIVHVHNRFFFTSFLGLLYASIYDYALVTSLHLGALDHLEGAGGLAAGLFQSTFSKRLVNSSDAVICVSNAVAAVARDLGADPAGIHVVRNAVDLDQFEVAPKTFDKSLLYIGRLVANNGPQDLLQAVPDIIEAHPEATIHMVGSGTLQESLEDEITKLGIEDAITMHGFVDDITEMYAMADVFCRPSYSEGLPLTLLESMATYTVPVVTPVAGAEEIVTDGSTGCFVDVGKPETIAETVNTLFDEPERVTTMAQTAREYVEANHSWTRRTQDIMSIYQSVSNE
jgi:glycosyltransferase involved in cell wall biosynthesis